MACLRRSGPEPYLADSAGGYFAALWIEESDLGGGERLGRGAAEMLVARPMVFGRQRHDRPRSLGHAIDLDKTGTEDRHRLVEQGGRDRARTVEDMVKAAEVGGFGPREGEEDGGRRVV